MKTIETRMHEIVNKVADINRYLVNLSNEYDITNDETLKEYAKSAISLRDSLIDEYANLMEKNVCTC